MGSPVRRRRLVANTITAKPTASPPTTKNITTASQDTLRTARPQDQFAEFTHVGRPPLKSGKNSASVLRQHGAFSAVLCWLPTLIQCGSFVLFGTHPEAVKLAPLVRELRNHPRIHTDVINSGQHGDAPPKLLEELGVQTDEDLGTVTSASLSEMAGWLGRKLRDSRATLQQDWNRVDSRLWWQGHRGCVRSSEWHRKGARASLHHRILRVGDARSARRAVVRVAASGCRRRLQGVCNRAGCNAGPKALRGAGTSNADFTSVTVTGFARRWLSRSTGVHASVEYQRFLNSYQRIGLGGRLFVEFELASRMNALVSLVGRAASFARKVSPRGYWRGGA